MFGERCSRDYCCDGDVQRAAKTVMLRAMSGRYYPGYAVAAVSTLALAMTAPGQTILVSLLNVPLRTEFDIAPLTLNTAYTVATLLAAVPLLWVGKLADRYGPRKMLMLVALAFSGGCLFTASIAHVAMVFVAFFLLRFLGQGSLALVSNHALAMWFHRRLGTIAGFRSVALFAAWAPLPALTVWLIGRVGWRLTWAIFGAMVGLCVAGLTWRFVRDRPEDLGLKMDGDSASAHRDASALPAEPGLSLPQARQTAAYWLLVAGVMLPPMIGTAILFDIQPLLGKQGVDAAAAARAVSAWSASMAILALPVGGLIDRVAPRWLMAGGALALAGCSVLLPRAHSELWAMAALALHALGQSLSGATVAACSARFFGRRHHGAIRSSLSRLGVIATGLGPLAFGLSQRATGNYGAALSIFAVLCLPVAVASLWLRAPDGTLAEA